MIIKCFCLCLYYFLGNIILTVRVSILVVPPLELFVSQLYLLSLNAISFINDLGSLRNVSHGQRPRKVPWMNPDLTNLISQEGALVRLLATACLRWRAQKNSSHLFHVLVSIPAWWLPGCFLQIQGGTIYECENSAPYLAQVYLNKQQGTKNGGLSHR